MRQSYGRGSRRDTPCAARERLGPAAEKAEAAARTWPAAAAVVGEAEAEWSQAQGCAQGRAPQWLQDWNGERGEAWPHEGGRPASEAGQGSTGGYRSERGAGLSSRDAVSCTPISRRAGGLRGAGRGCHADRARAERNRLPVRSRHLFAGPSQSGGGHQPHRQRRHQLRRKADLVAGRQQGRLRQRLHQNRSWRKERLRDARGGQRQRNQPRHPDQRVPDRRQGDRRPRLVA